MLFDDSDEETEEVSLRAPEDDNQDSEEDAELHNEVETRLGNSSQSTGRGTSIGSSGSSVSLEDIKEQNEKIISLLRDIRNGTDSSSETEEDRNTTPGGDPTELL